MKVLIPTIMYGRWDTFRVFAKGIQDLRDAFPDIQFDVLVVGTGDEKIVKEYGYEYHEYINEPLSQKAQHRLELSRDKADYYLFLGSDDIITPNTFRYYLDKINQGCKWIAPLDLYCWKEGNVYHSQGYKSNNPRHGESLAVGRCLSNDVLHRVNWTLWDEIKPRNIDKQAYNKLKRLGIRKDFFRLTEIGGFICDIKSEHNVSKWHSGWVIKGRDKQFFRQEYIDLLKEI